MKSWRFLSLILEYFSSYSGIYTIRVCVQTHDRVILICIATCSAFLFFASFVYFIGIYIVYLMINIYAVLRIREHIRLRNAKMIFATILCNCSFFLYFFYCCRWIKYRDVLFFYKKKKHFSLSRVVWINGKHRSIWLCIPECFTLDQGRFRIHKFTQYFIWIFCA